MALRNSREPYNAGTFDVSFEFPTNCKVMVDAAIWLLSLANQLACAARRSASILKTGQVSPPCEPVSRRGLGF
jgi:hypothetical protein